MEEKILNYTKYNHEEYKHFMWFESLHLHGKEWLIQSFEGVLTLK